jgi:hypothetical protein
MLRSSEPADSETLVDPGLLQDGVRGVSRLDLSIDDKASLRDRTEPDLVVAFALPLEATAVREEKFLELRSIRGHSGGQPDFFLALARQLKGDRIRLTARQELIRLEKLGNDGPKLLGQSFNRRCLRGQPGHVFARCDPNPGFGVPVGVDMIEKTHRLTE